MSLNKIITVVIENYELIASFFTVASFLVWCLTKAMTTYRRDSPPIETIQFKEKNPINIKEDLVIVVFSIIGIPLVILLHPYLQPILHFILMP